MTDDDDDSGECTLRERKKNATRRAIHLTALALVEANGVTATTIEQICEEVGISPRTFFNYFPSKPAAVLGLPDTLIAPQAIERFRAAHGDLIPAMCDLIGDLAEQNREHQRVKDILAEQPELAPAFGQWTSKVRGELVALAQERTEDPRVGAGAVALVMAALNLVIHGADEESESASERLRTVVNRLFALRHAPLAPLPE